MRFKFQLHNGKVRFFTWLTLCFQAMLLLIIRFLRFCKRIFVYLKRYIPIFFCIVIFESIIIPVGIHLGKYLSWVDGLWDLRSFFFTAILISVVNGILQEEHKRNKGLRKQFEAYKLFMLESEQFIDRLCLLLGVEYRNDRFLKEDMHQEFLNCVYDRIHECAKQPGRKIIELPVVQDPHFMYSTPQVKPNTYVKVVFDRYLRAIDTLNQNILQSSFIGTIDHAIAQLDYIYENVQMELIQIESDSDSYTENQLLGFTESICRCIYPAIADIRRPWRWDIEINSAMDKLLEK